MLLPLLAVLPAFAAGPLAAFDRNVAIAEPKPGELALELRAGVEPAPLAASVGCAVDHQWGGRPIWTLRCGDDADLRATIGALGDRPGVRDVSAAFPAALTATEPNDYRGGWWQLAKVGAAEAWDVSTGDPSVVVAVVDTGVRTDHEDLLANIWVNPGETCGNGVDDDGNGYIDDCEGWDVGDGDADVSPLGLSDTDPSGASCAKIHGTFISGLVGETGDNSVGGVGVNWDVGLMPLKMVDDATCGLTDLTIAEAITYATDNGAHVINASWHFTTYSGRVAGALTDAANSGVLLVIAAGNDGADVDTLSTSYPIWMGTPNDIVVAATNSNDNLAGFSNYGANMVDLAAPGANVKSTGIRSTSRYENGYGTSYAAPMVAGAAALVWSAWPMLSAEEVRASIIDGVAAKSNLDCANVTKCVKTGGRLSLPGAMTQAEAWATRVSLVGADLVVDDADEGDGDGVAELTERARLVYVLDNAGHGDAGGVTATLALDAVDVTVEDDTIAFGDVAGDAAGVEAEDDSFVLLVEETCTADQEATATVTVSTDAGDTWTEAWPLTIACVVDDDADGSLYPYDCDDTADTVFPGADETCNEVDDDCDGDVDEDAVDVSTFFADTDGDGHGDAADMVEACAPPDGYVDSDDDCDDGADSVSPSADEVCNDVDDDCDGDVDEDADCEPAHGSPGAGDGKGDEAPSTCATAPGGALAFGWVVGLVGLVRRRGRR